MNRYYEIVCHWSAYILIYSIYLFDMLQSRCNGQVRLILNTPLNFRTFSLHKKKIDTFEHFSLVKYYDTNTTKAMILNVKRKSVTWVEISKFDLRPFCWFNTW